MADVVRLGPHERMKPEEALAEAAAGQWDQIVIAGYHVGSDDLVVMSSHMSREHSLWLVEHLKLHVLGRL